MIGTQQYPGRNQWSGQFDPLPPGSKRNDAIPVEALPELMTADQAVAGNDDGQRIPTLLQRLRRNLSLAPNHDG